MNPILMEFPHAFESERLLIHMPEREDAKAVFEAITASRASLKEFLAFAHSEKTLEEIEVSLYEAKLDFLRRKDLRMHLFLKESGQFIGSSGLHRIDWTVPRFEIGYWIDSRFSGKGYMTEAVERIEQFAFETLKARRVEICCDEKNAKSRKIPEKLNYQLEGTIRNNHLAAGGEELRNLCIYAKISRNT